MGVHRSEPHRFPAGEVGAYSAGRSLKTSENM